MAKTPKNVRPPSNRGERTSAAAQGFGIPPSTKGGRPVKEKHLYRIGVNSDCPVHQVFLGGQCFPRTSERVEITATGATARETLQGALVLMDEDNLRKVRQHSETKVIRTTHQGTRAGVHSTLSPRYRPAAGDLPVSRFVYIQPVVANPHENVIAEPTLEATMEDLLATNAALDERAFQDRLRAVEAEDKARLLEAELAALRAGKDTPAVGAARPLIEGDDPTELLDPIE